MEFITWISDNWDHIVDVWTKLVTFVSAILLLVPVLPDGHPLLPLVKWLGKFVALNRNIGKRPKA